MDATETSTATNTRYDFEACKVCQGPIQVESARTPDELTVARCLDCKLLFVKTIPQSRLWSDDSVESVRQYYNLYQGVPAKFRHGLALIQQTLAKTHPHAQPSTLKLLDVGCGRGDFLALAQAEGFQVSGIEMSRGAIELCQERGLDSIHYGLLDALDERFDVISLFDVAEHVEDLQTFLSQLKDRLAPGGLIFIEVPRYCLLDQYLKIVALFTRRTPYSRLSREHVQLYSDRSLRKLLGRHGLEILHFETKTQLSWDDKKQYIRNMGIHAEWLVNLLEKLANLFLALGILGRNKAIVMARPAA